MGLVLEMNHNVISNFVLVIIIFTSLTIRVLFKNKSVYVKLLLCSIFFSSVSVGVLLQLHFLTESSSLF